MPAHRYDPIPSTDRNDGFSLKEFEESESAPSYTASQASAPPSFDSHLNSLRVEQPVPFGAVVPGSATVTMIPSTYNASSTNLSTNDTNATTAWTSSSNTAQNEMIGMLLTRIEKLEADAIARQIGEDFAEVETEEVGENSSLRTKPRKRSEERDNIVCCRSALAMICTVFCILAMFVAIVAIEWVKAWGRKKDCSTSN